MDDEEDFSALFGAGVKTLWQGGRGKKNKPKKVKTGLTAGATLPQDIATKLSE
jgi:hypothetical protein